MYVELFYSHWEIACRQNLYFVPFFTMSLILYCVSKVINYQPQQLKVNCTLQLYICCHLSSSEELVVKPIRLVYCSNKTFELMRRSYIRILLFISLKKTCVEYLLSILDYYDK